MAKLTKKEAANHAKALEYLKQDILSEDQKEFVFNHYHEAATHINPVAGAFFTPLELAWEFGLAAADEYPNRPESCIDLCAGIGVLTYQLVQRHPQHEYVCVEINPDYVEIGKKLVPEATWICADVMDIETMLRLGHFDYAYSNPPFGNVPSMTKKPGYRYSGNEAEYKVIDIASLISNVGTFILPQMSAGFAYSGVNQYQEKNSKKLEKFRADTGLELSSAIGIDTTVFELEHNWKTAVPVVEFAECDFRECHIKEVQTTLF